LPATHGARTSDFDLFADARRSADAIGRFAGPAEARGYLEFCARSERVYLTLRDSFIRAQRPSVFSLTQAAGLRGLGDLARMSPFATLWQVLGEYFNDPRLRQLFGRHATYCGSSPFLAPATLMLITHVEQEGVWLVEGGMQRVADALATLAQARGATIRYGAEVAYIIVEKARAAGVTLATDERIGPTPWSSMRIRRRSPGAISALPSVARSPRRRARIARSRP
jgi:1-hydroxycarotenoid 3,4-desaturase